MSKVQNLAEIAPNIPFTEFNFYDLYREYDVWDGNEYDDETIVHRILNLGEVTVLPAPEDGFVIWRGCY